MMRRIVRLGGVLLSISCAAVLLSPLACGKYGRPKRVVGLQQIEEQPPTAASGRSVEIDPSPGVDLEESEDGADQSRKP